MLLKPEQFCHTAHTVSVTVFVCVLLIKTLFCQVNTMSDKCSGVKSILKPQSTFPGFSDFALIFQQNCKKHLLCNLTIQNQAHLHEPTSVIARGALEGIFHLRFSNLIRKSSAYAGALGCAGARLAGLVLTAEAHNLRLVMKGGGQGWMSGACLLGLVCATTWFACLS